MNWVRDGEKLEATYAGYPIKGTVLESRVKYGGDVQYTVQLDTPIQLPWRTDQTHRVLIVESEIKSMTYDSP